MIRKAGLAGIPFYGLRQGIASCKLPEKSCRSSSPSPDDEISDFEKKGIFGSEDSVLAEIQPSDEIIMMKDMLAVAGIEGRDATALVLHFKKASKQLKSGNSRGFETEAELFYMEFDRIYYDETECIFHSY